MFGGYFGPQGELHRTDIGHSGRCSWYPFRKLVYTVSKSILKQSDVGFRGSRHVSTQSTRQRPGDFGKVLAFTFCMWHLWRMVRYTSLEALYSPLEARLPNSDRDCMHDLPDVQGLTAAKQKAWYLLITLIICSCYKVLSDYILGTILDLHIRSTVSGRRPSNSIIGIFTH